jgi:hypothetical protein
MENRRQPRHRLETRKRRMTPTPITDAATMHALLDAAHTIRTTLDDGRFDLENIDGRPAIVSFDYETGAAVAVTLDEPDPVVWHLPAPTAEGGASAGDRRRLTGAEVVQAMYAEATLNPDPITPPEPDGRVQSVYGDNLRARGVTVYDDPAPPGVPGVPGVLYADHRYQQAKVDALGPKADSRGKCVHGFRAHVIPGVACLPHTCDDTCRYTDHSYVPAGGPVTGGATDTDPGPVGSTPVPSWAEIDAKMRNLKRGDAHPLDTGQKVKITGILDSSGNPVADQRLASQSERGALGLRAAVTDANAAKSKPGRP